VEAGRIGVEDMTLKKGEVDDRVERDDSFERDGRDGRDDRDFVDNRRKEVSSMHKSMLFVRMQWG
jgi:hypothetical protein